MPAASLVELPWVHAFAQTSDATFAGYTGTQTVVRINNAYNPCDSTHQPYGWDQMAALYNNYKVVGCRMEVTVSNNTSENCVTLVRSCPVNENTNLNNVSMLSAERPGVDLLFTAPGQPIAHWSKTFDIPALCGVSKEQYQADVSQYSAAVTAAPSRYAFVQIATQASATSTQVSVTIRVFYRVQFWQRQTQAAS